ncbi:TonB-dependent receptor [Burkholderia sp. Bp9131]|nr:TonB-dependent receptor [Burkholderia sp. Bp9131]
MVRPTSIEREAKRAADRAIGTARILGYFLIWADLSNFQLEQPTAYTDSATNVFAANGTQRHRGIELSVYGEPVNGVRLLAGATLINAKALNTKGGINDGDRPIGVPAYLFNVSGEYDLPFAPGVTLDAAWIHTGRRACQNFSVTRS